MAIGDPWFEREGWDGGPGLHAFVVGISAYAHLPAPGQPVLPHHYGMRQLSAPALTAYRLAATLRSQADQFDPPLATLRLLVAPSADEVKAEAALYDMTV